MSSRARDERLPQRPVDVVLPRRARPRRGPCSASATRPGPTSSPASRSTRPNVTMCRDDRATGHGRGDEAASVSSRTESRSSWYLSTEPSVVCDVLGVELPLAERGQRLRPVDRLRDARAASAGRARAARRRTRPPRAASRSGTPGHAQLHDLDLALERWVADPVEEAAALERVVQLARAVRREDHARPLLRLDRARARGS